VLRLLEDSERVVPAGTPILELGNPANLEIVVEVLSTDAVGIAAGAAMTVDVGGGRRLAGQVREVEPAGFTKISPLGVEEQRVRVVGELDPGRAEGMPGEKGRQAFTAALGDRFRVRGHIVLWRGDAVIQAPSGAVFRTGDGWAAYRIDAGRARLTRVEVGHRGADTVEVLSGLGVGDRLVLYPGARITDGARVRGLEHGAPGTPP
jgi:HlyD family secretion protein